MPNSPSTSFVLQHSPNKNNNWDNHQNITFTPAFTSQGTPVANTSFNRISAFQKTSGPINKSFEGTYPLQYDAEIDAVDEMLSEKVGNFGT